jgi:branched-chain amino acid transport system ATP-binding protein
MSRESTWGHEMSENLLTVKELDVTRGGSLVLRDVSLFAEKGEIIALIGPNGAGKSTLFGAILGLYKISKGTIEFAGRQLKGMSTTKISELISLVPQEFATFPFLSVIDNLWISKGTSRQQVLADKIFDIFPVLREKKDQEAWSLSGGQRQMLSIGIGLIRKSQVLMLDEPTLGLSPVNVDRILTAIKKISEDFRLTIVISDQTPRVLDVANRVYVMEGGQIRIHGTAEELRNDERITKVYLGMAI